MDNILLCIYNVDHVQDVTMNKDLSVATVHWRKTVEDPFGEQLKKVKSNKLVRNALAVFSSFS